MTRRVIFPDPDIWTRKEIHMTPQADYERLHDFTRLLWDVAAMLRLKGRTEAADIVHTEAINFAAQRDIARAVADVELDLDNPVKSKDLGYLDD